MPFLPPNQQRQSTEGVSYVCKSRNNLILGVKTLQLMKHKRELLHVKNGRNIVILKYCNICGKMIKRCCPFSGLSKHQSDQGVYGNWSDSHLIEP